MSDYTAIVSGAGPAGLAAAILLKLDGVSTAIIAPESPNDPRTVALMQPSLQLLKFIGVWTDDLKSHCAPLKHLQIVDDTGNYVTAPPLTFSAREIDLEAFGWNVPLTYLVPILRRRAEELEIPIFATTSAGTEQIEGGIAITTSDGRRFVAKVAIAADGSESVLRKSIGVGIENWSFDQSALVTSFAHSGTHNFMSTEYHKSAGAFTTVPLPDNHSSLVWMDRPARVEGLFSLSDVELATEIQLETKGNLGRIFHMGPRKIFPMRGKRATVLARNRTIMIGEAAHVFPPIGAQGLNMSLRDAAQAADLIIGTDDPGAESVMKEYNTLRSTDVVPRQHMIQFVNNSLLASFPALPLARVAGLTAIASFPPLRQLAMQQGLAPTANLPFAMRG